MKKILSFTFALASIFLLCSFPASTASYVPPFDVSAQSAYIVNLDSNMVMYEKNKDQPIHPGGLTQIMTVILALESVTDLENTTVTMKNYIQDDMYIKNKEYGRIPLAGLLRGETLSIKNLLYAIMLPGANEAASMVADYVGDGSANYFVELMNKRAKELGAHNTNFLTPHGLPDASYTTAYDMYLITTHAMTLPGFMEMAQTISYNGGPTNLHDTLNWHTANRMLVKSHSSYYAPIRGIKAASNTKLGSSMISTAQKGGYSYMSVIMGCPTTNSMGEPVAENQSFVTTKKLYEWAFDTFKVKTLLENEKNFGEISLKLAWGKDFVRLMAADSFTALIPDDIEATSILFETQLPDYIKAPINRGDPVGYVELWLAGEQIGTVMLVSADTVKENKLLVFFDEIKIITQSYLFKFSIVFFFVLIVIYILYTIAKNRRYRRYSSKRRG